MDIRPFHSIQIALFCWVLNPIFMDLDRTLVQCYCQAEFFSEDFSETNSNYEDHVDLF